MPRCSVNQDVNVWLWQREIILRTGFVEVAKVNAHADSAVLFRDRNSVG